MKIEIEKIIKHKVKVTIDKNAWDTIAKIIDSNCLYEVIAFNAIERVGSTYRKKFCWVEYMAPARLYAILDTLKAMGIDEYIVIKPYNYKKKDLYVEYTNKKSNIQGQPIVNIVAKDSL